MTADLFTHPDPAQSPRQARPSRPPEPRQAQTTHTRLPTIGEHACNTCGFAACFFDGATGWCWVCRPAEFLPGGRA